MCRGRCRCQEAILKEQKQEKKAEAHQITQELQWNQLQRVWWIDEIKLELFGLISCQYVQRRSGKILQWV